jgi:hypothetical protein
MVECHLPNPIIMHYSRLITAMDMPRIASLITLLFWIGCLIYESYSCGFGITDRREEDEADDEPVEQAGIDAQDGRPLSLRKRFGKEGYPIGVC